MYKTARRSKNTVPLSNKHQAYLLSRGTGFDDRSWWKEQVSPL